MTKSKKTYTSKKGRTKASLKSNKSHQRITAIKAHFNALKRWKQISIYIVATSLLLVAIRTATEPLWPEVKNPNYGVSFSIKYANELGVDWKQNFIALLDDIKLRNFRLMSYWDDTEAVRGTYNFENLDWQMTEAAKRNAKVSLAIGLRQPRWPECHKPSWYEPLSESEKDQATLDFVAEVVKRYKDHPALQSYQLENEAMNSWFGGCTQADRNRQRFTKELELIKKIDPAHPVYMSLSDQHGLPLGGPTPDKFGYSVYRTIWSQDIGPYKGYLTYPTDIWYHRLRAVVLKVFWKRDIFIHELQLEPWGPVATKDLSVDEQSKSMSTEQIAKNLRFARQIGTEDIYTWGSEWWYWRKTVHNDPTVWNTVKQELNKL